MTEHTSRNSIAVSQNGFSFSTLKPSIDLAGIASYGRYSTETEQASAGSAINAVDIDWGQVDIKSAIVWNAPNDVVLKTIQM